MPTWSEFPSKALWTASIITQMPSMPRTASLVNRPSSSMLCFARSPPIWSRCAPNAANLALENVAQKTINYLPNLAKKCIPQHTETGQKINPKCALTSCHSRLTPLCSGLEEVKRDASPTVHTFLVPKNSFFPSLPSVQILDPFAGLRNRKIKRNIIQSLREHRALRASFSRCVSNEKDATKSSKAHYAARPKSEVNG